MKQYYHVTLTKNLKSILENGLIPTLGELAQLCDETETKIYLFPSLTDMETALSSWLGEAINNQYGEDIKCCSLEITLPDEFPITNGDVEYEAYSYLTIPPQYIRYLKDE